MNGTGITWKTDLWNQRTSILYEEEEIGFLKMEMWSFKRKATALLLDREYELKSVNFWATKVVIIDKIDERIIATLTTNMWSNKTQLYVEQDDETFIFKQNMWSTGGWWWEKKYNQLEINQNATLPKLNEKLVQNSISNFLTGKGEFNFGNIGESNLNALILGGIFTMKIRQQAAAG